MSKNGKAVKRISLSFTDANKNPCDDAMFRYIELVTLHNRTALYHNAFRSGMLLAMIDERLPVILATLASVDDPKTAVLSALRATGNDIAWDAELYPAGYRKRALLTTDQRQVIQNEDGYTVWATATKDEYLSFVSGDMPEGTQVEALFAKREGIVETKKPEPTKSEPKDEPQRALIIEPVKESAAGKVRSSLLG